MCCKIEKMKTTENDASIYDQKKKIMEEIKWYSRKSDFFCKIMSKKKKSVVVIVCNNTATCSLPI